MSNKEPKQFKKITEISAEDVFALLRQRGHFPASAAQCYVMGTALEETILYLMGHRDAPSNAKIDILAPFCGRGSMGCTEHVEEYYSPHTQQQERMELGIKLPAIPPTDRPQTAVMTAFNTVSLKTSPNSQDATVDIHKFKETRLYTLFSRAYGDLMGLLHSTDLNCSQVALSFSYNRVEEKFEGVQLHYTQMYADFLNTRQIIPVNFQQPAYAVARALKKQKSGMGYFENSRYVELVHLAQQLYGTGTLRRLFLNDTAEFKAFQAATPQLNAYTSAISNTFRVKNGLSWVLKCAFPSRPLRPVDDWFEESYTTEMQLQLASKLGITQDGKRAIPLPEYSEKELRMISSHDELMKDMLYKEITSSNSEYPGKLYAGLPLVMHQDAKLLSTMFTLIVRADSQNTLEPNARGYRDHLRILQHEQQFWNYKGVKHAKDSHALHDVVTNYYKDIGIAHCMFETKTVSPYELMMISQRLTEVSLDRAERLIALFGMYMQRPRGTKVPAFAYQFFLKRDNGLLGKFPLEDARYALKHLYLHPEAIEFMLKHVHAANWRKVHDALIKATQQAGLLNTHYALYFQMHQELTPPTMAALKEPVTQEFIDEHVTPRLFEYLDMKSQEGVLIMKRHQVPMPDDLEMEDLKSQAGLTFKLLVEEIVLADDLAREGKEMSHCVGGYGAQVKASSCRIIRFRNESREKSATAEWRFQKENGRWTINCYQIRSFANRTPPEEVRRMNELLQEYVLSVVNASAESIEHYGFLKHIRR